MSDHTRKIILVSGMILAIGALLGLAWAVYVIRWMPRASAAPTFDDQRAFRDIEYQLSLGPRTIGSVAHAETVKYIADELRGEGWKVEVQELDVGGHVIQNVIAKRGKGSSWIILGAHYDSRFFADRDPDPANRQLPVPGANDGASGVAVLLELGRVLPTKLDRRVWLVFFDAEDNGNLLGWDWFMGSHAFVANLQGKPDAVVVVDMIGDANLEIYQEASSNISLKEVIWQQAANLGYEQFRPEVKYSVIDDHTPFLQAGIPAVDVIDLDYPYWHTTSDTLDKVSAASLDAVGETILAWLMQYGK